MKFKVGDRIRCTDDRSAKGIVTKIITDDEELVVRWDVVYCGERNSHLEPREIRLDDLEADKATALLVQAKINEATHSLEAAFQLWKEAQELHGEYSGAGDLMRDSMLDTDSFTSIINAQGWETSTLLC
jgi:hypothetical protein